MYIFHKKSYHLIFFCDMTLKFDKNSKYNDSYLFTPTTLLALKPIVDYVLNN